MQRIYNDLIREHLVQNRQMAFVSGPRQVGKTTSAQMIDENALYINWDNQGDRLNITKGPDNLVRVYNLDALGKKDSLIILDEIHKYGKWKQFLKGFFDSYGTDFKILVTGSARLNIYKKSGDSLMGRYFNYRLHPLSVAETIHSDLIEKEIREPQNFPDQTMKDLLEYGGFPEPFLKADKRFYNRWRRLRTEQFFYEDVRDLTNVQEISLIETLAEILKHQTGQLTNYSSLAQDLNISVDTVKRWLVILERLYYCYSIRPYFVNIPKSLRKQPKYFLWDWSLIPDKGARHENIVASHLLKAVHYWSDAGFGDYGLFYLRDKMKREVDFLITRDNTPWILVEVKSSSSKRISPHLEYFSHILKTDHTFQIELNADYVDEDCFSVKRPVKVPAKTLLSQLV
ncbi:ATP-binding protein [Desulfobacter latus]|nr:ATP-binding protein [Desulfobacter latus]